MDKDVRGDVSFEEGTKTREALPRLDCEALEAVSTHGRSLVQVSPLLMADVLVSWVSWVVQLSEQQISRAIGDGQILPHEHDC
jgi:hypothetical protein